MKFRKSFVTNSSSSSFILSFKNENDYNEFKEYCNEYGYEEFFNLIESIKNTNLNGLIDEEDGTIIIEKRNFLDIKKECLEKMEQFFTFEDVHQYLEEKTKHITDFKNKIKEEKKIKETDEFKEFYKSLFVKKDFKEELNKYLEEKCGSDISKQLEFIKSNEYKSYRDDLLKNNRYFNGIEKLKQDSIIVDGMIWDTNGGLLEWAIRNGLLESEFNKWTIMIENIG